MPRTLGTDIREESEVLSRGQDEPYSEMAVPGNLHNPKERPAGDTNTLCRYIGLRCHKGDLGDLANQVETGQGDDEAEGPYSGPKYV